jgi:hypothetical protein
MLAMSMMKLLTVVTERFKHHVHILQSVKVKKDISWQSLKSYIPVCFPGTINATNDTPQPLLLNMLEINRSNMQIEFTEMYRHESRVPV